MPVLTTPVGSIKVKEGFRVELLYTVPKNEQGTWVCICVDPKGRLIASDQNGRLYRITPPTINGRPTDTKVELLPVDLGEAHGLCWANNALYVVVNRMSRYESGLWRVYSSKNDDSLDAAVKLRGFEGQTSNNEHGPHGVVLSPDGRSLYVVCGNDTKLTAITGSAVPACWGDDSLLPQMEDPKGLFVGFKPPGGCIYQTDLGGKEWKLVSMGSRNCYDIAFNREGELFTADNDMDWDFNLPWYRPTRIAHAVPGSDFGWRRGNGKEYESYPDNAPAVVNIGVGAPAGVCFGYGARFPEKYQNDLFVCDWAYGKLYAVHLTPSGSTYHGELEEFISGTPLPLSDIAVNPFDGAVYFTIGGRGTVSGLYRVTYVGPDSTAPAKDEMPGADLRSTRRALESLYGRAEPGAVATAWPYLASDDRFIRYAARTVLEFQPPAAWETRAINEQDPKKLIYALLGLARVGDKSLEPSILGAMERVNWDELSQSQQTDYLRTYEVVFCRMGYPAPAWRVRIAGRLNKRFPSDSRETNAELCRLLSYLDDPQVVTKSIDLLAKAGSEEEQIEYITSLRVVKSGWSIRQREDYFRWFLNAATFTGGQSLPGYLAKIRGDAIESLDDQQRAALKSILDRPVRPTVPTVTVQDRPFVKDWTVEELVPIVEKGLAGRDVARGHRLFAESGCSSCHRCNNEGGPLGPDLTGVAGRLSVHDLLESIIEPSKVIADEYATQVIATIDGDRLEGRTVGADGDNLWVITNMLDPSQITKISRKDIKSIVLSKVSIMPTGLLNRLTKDEILDLVRYLFYSSDRTMSTHIQK
jgi:putative heme-binding domain-containing protein